MMKKRGAAKYMQLLEGSPPDDSDGEEEQQEEQKGMQWTTYFLIMFLCLTAIAMILVLATRNLSLDNSLFSVLVCDCE